MHRDVKPDNVYVCDDGLVKLIDFGVAKVLGSTFIQTGPGLPPGTFRYMAPDAVNEETTTPAMDLYSLGVTFWEMLAGQHPFLHGLPKDVMRAIVEEGVPPLDGISSVIAKTPAELCRVVMRACARNPADRFASAEEFAEAIDLAMGHRRSTRPLADGIYPRSYFDGSLASKPPPVPLPAPAPLLTQATAPEHSPGTALGLWAPMPLVAPEDEAGRSPVVADHRKDDQNHADRSSPEAYQSSVLVRGQGLDSDDMPPQAPWLPAPPGPSSAPERGGASFGVLSHVPPSPWQQAAPPAALEDRTPNSTPPLVSETVSKNDAIVAADKVEASPSDEATTLPRGGGPSAGGRWWARILPPHRDAGHLQAAGVTKRVALAGAGALTLTALGFLTGQIWRAPTAPRLASSAGPDARHGAPPGSAGPFVLTPSAQPTVATSTAALAALPSEVASVPAGPASGAPSPSASGARGGLAVTPPNAAPLAPATLSAQGGDRASKREATRATPRRGARAGTAPTARPAVRLPKGGLDSGF